MNLFTIKGKIDDQEYSVEYLWEDGVGSLKGDQNIIDYMELYELKLNTSTGPVGCSLPRNLNIPMAALCMLQDCFHEVVSIEGDIPMLPKLKGDQIG